MVFLNNKLQKKLANDSEGPRKNKEEDEDDEEDEYDINRFTKNAYYLLHADFCNIYDEIYFSNTNTKFSFFFILSLLCILYM